MSHTSTAQHPTDSLVDEVFRSARKYRIAWRNAEENPRDETWKRAEVVTYKRFCAAVYALAESRKAA